MKIAINPSVKPSRTELCIVAATVIAMLITFCWPQNVHAEEKILGLDGLQFAQELKAGESIPIAEKKKEEVPTKTFDVSGFIKLRTKYVGDTGKEFSNGAVNQDQLMVSHNPTGLYGLLWISTPFKDINRKENPAFEADIAFGWYKELKDIGVAVDLGVYYWDLNPVFSIAAGDIIQPYAEVSKTYNPVEGVHSLTSSFKVEYGIPAQNVKEDAGLKGLHIHGGLKHGWQITKSINIGSKVAAGYDFHAYGAGDAMVLDGEIGPTAKLNDWVSITTSVRLVGRITGNDRGFEDVYMVGLVFGGSGDD